MRIVLLMVILAVGLVANPAFLHGQKGASLAGPYDAVEKWPQWAHPYPRQGYIWGSQGGVFAQTPDRIFLANRGELKLPDKIGPNFNGSWGSLNLGSAGSSGLEFHNCIVVVDANGKLIEAWTQWDHLFVGGRGPHSVKISPYDPEHHVWVVDDMRHQIFKFTNDGKKLVMTLGEAGVPGDNDDLTRFRRPTDIAWLPDGTFFISDGYENTRVVKFDKNGKPIMKWGTKGTAPGQFNTPHGVAVGADRRVYVSDRGNHRIQVFDEQGKYIEEWPNIPFPVTIFMSSDNHLWVFDGVVGEFLKFDLSGHLEYSFGTPALMAPSGYTSGQLPGGVWEVHQISADSDGNMYAADVFAGRTQKFRPKPGADPTRLIRAVPLMARAPVGR